jgi:hypothetical protein
MVPREPINRDGEAMVMNEATLNPGDAVREMERTPSASYFHNILLGRRKSGSLQYECPDILMSNVLMSGTFKHFEAVCLSNYLF